MKGSEKFFEITDLNWEIEEWTQARQAIPQFPGLVKIENCLLLGVCEERD
jgi:hypothetical protein